MDGIASFLDLVDRYRAAKGIGDARVSTLIFNDGNRIKDIRRGDSDIGVMRLERAIQWLGENWPDGTDRPASLPVKASLAEAS